MSYILDALKKSDQERKQGDVPTLQTVHIPIAVEQSKPWPLYGLILLLLLALAFVIGMIIPAEPNKVVSIEESSNRVEPAERMQDKPAAYEPVPSAKAQERRKIVVSASLSKPLKNKAVVERRSVITEKTNEIYNIPYLHELDDYKQQSVPVLNFAGHVFSSQASSRTVIINGHAMSEGEVIVAGLKVEEITINGVVLSLHGEYFRMDILQDWSFD